MTGITVGRALDAVLMFEQEDCERLINMTSKVTSEPIAMPDKIGMLYTVLMTGYFMVSGLSVLFDVPGKLARIGLSAVNSDGEIAFILIYCGLMVGIGAAMALMAYLSRSWVYPAVLATAIVASFIIFRLVGSFMMGSLSDTQITFITVELLEVALGSFILCRFGFPQST